MSLVFFSLDIAVARSLQEQYDREARLQSRSSTSTTIVDKKLELDDPTPNIHQLFVEYDSRFFWGKLAWL